MNMKMTKFALALISTYVLGACTTVNAHTKVSSSDLVANKLAVASVNNEAYRLNVYKDCQLLQSIAMNEKQRKAYDDLQQAEHNLQHLEKPLQDMEAQLAEHELALQALELKLVEEEADRLVINKKRVKQHKAIAKKIERVVASHQLDIDKLTSQAQQIEAKANAFQQAIAPSIGSLNQDNIQIRIGTQTQPWSCDA